MRAQSVAAARPARPWLTFLAGGAIGLAILVAMVVRYVSTGWRGLTVGFSAAIVGAGVTTVLYSVVGR